MGIEFVTTPEQSRVLAAYQGAIAEEVVQLQEAAAVQSRTAIVSGCPEAAQQADKLAWWAHGFEAAASDVEIVIEAAPRVGLSELLKVVQVRLEQASLELDAACTAAALRVVTPFGAWDQVEPAREEVLRCHWTAEALRALPGLVGRRLMWGQ